MKVPKENGLGARLKGSLYLAGLAIVHLFAPQYVYHRVAKAGHLMWTAIQEEEQ